MSTYRRQPPNPNLQLGPSLLSALHHAAQEPPTPLSENEIDLIFRLTSRVPAFAKYEEGVRRALASVVRYEVFGAGRVVVRQGHQAQNFYHILAGQVEVTKQVEDRVVVLSTLRGGDSFGETSLLHNHRRSATVTTLSTPTAFLRVSKADFLSILQAETERDIDAKAELIGSIPMFACLGAASVRHLATVSRTRSLGVGDVVVAEGSVPAFVFIVRDGACNVIKAAPFIRHPAKNGRTRLQPYIPPAPSTSPRRRRATDISRANLKTRERKMSIMLGLGGGGGNASLWFATPTVISGVAGAGGGTASSGKQASRASLLSGGGNNTGRLLTTGSRGNISFLPSLPTSTNLTAAQRPSRTPAIYKSPPSASPPPSTQLTTLLLRVVSLLPGDHIGTTSAILSHSPTHLIRPLPANSTPFSPFSLIAARPTRVLLISSPDFARLCNQEMAEMIGKEERSWQEVLGWEALAAGWRRGCEWRKFRKSVVEEVRKRAEQERERMFWDLKS
ncbi:hypothetical protein DFS34DRAFT_15899 [Phlyctochytrium arcticum]|nr:hypothetical protein DFS34DRAFT_15899 [Phlyctochytrium arcticum]